MSERREREEERSEFGAAMQQREYQREEDAGRIARLRAELEDVRGHYHRAVQDRGEHAATVVRLHHVLMDIEVTIQNGGASDAHIIWSIRDLVKKGIQG